MSRARNGLHKINAHFWNEDAYRKRVCSDVLHAHFWFKNARMSRARVWLARVTGALFERGRT